MYASEGSRVISLSAAKNDMINAETTIRENVYFEEF